MSRSDADGTNVVVLLDNCWYGLLPAPHVHLYRDVHNAQCTNKTLFFYVKNIAPFPYVE